MRPSRPRRQRGIGAQAKSQLCRPTARHRRALVIGLGRASARFTVVSAVGTRPPHDGHSGDRPSTVECAVQEGGNPERGMTSPTSPAGTSRSSGSTEHGDGQSPHGADLTTELPGAGSQVPANVAALGLKSVPFFHIACMTTAILRASGDGRALEAETLLEGQAPSAQIALALHPRQHGRCGFIEQGVQPGIAATRDMPVVIDLARLVAPRRGSMSKYGRSGVVRGVGGG